MIKRPKPSDDEGEILKQQEEFLKNKSEKPAATVVNKRQQQPVAESSQTAAKKPKSKFAIERERLAAIRQGPTNRQLLGEIRERNLSAVVTPPKLENVQGFPSAFTRDKLLKQTDGSIFSQQLGMKKPGPRRSSPEPLEGNMQTFGDRSYVVSGPEAAEIHLANAQRLAEMSVEDIVKEREALITQLDPSLLSFLRSRRVKKETEAECKEMEVDVTAEEQCSTEALPSTPSPAEGVDAMETEVRDEWTLEDPGRFPHMDVLEEDKLLWTQPVPSGKTPIDSVSARFDFNGLLLAADDPSPTSQGLHHHGDEADRPGYTVQELLILGRSSMSSQRTTALATLANILAKIRLGYFDECFEPPLLQQLLERELFLFLRFALDDANLSVACAAVWALRHLLCDSADQVLLARCDGSVMDLRPGLAVHTELTNQEAAEMKDHEVLAVDVIEGALRSGLVDRLNYVLSRLSPPENTASATLDILARMARHSAAACRALVSSGAVDTAFRLHASPAAASRALRLVRVVCRDAALAEDVLRRTRLMERMPALLELTQDSGEATARIPMLLETFYLWRRLLDLGLTAQYISPLSPLALSVWHRVAQATDLGAGAGDLALASAVVAWLRSACAADGVALALVGAALAGCLQRWLAQVTAVAEPTFPMMKLLGITLSCTAVFFTQVSQKEEANDARLAETERRLKPLLEEGGVFSHLISNLHRCSNLVHRGERCRRHPSSLPSAGGVLPGGQLVPVMRPDAPHLLLLGLADLLLAARPALPQARQLLLSSPSLAAAVESIVGCDTPALVGNCFTRIETRLLARLALLACGSQPEAAPTHATDLFHRLAFKLSWLIAKADRPLLSALLREVVFNPRLLPPPHDSLLPASELYAARLGLDAADQSDNSSEPALPADWCFLPLLGLAESADTGDRQLEVARTCLGWAALCEARRLTAGVDVTARFCRVVAVFLAGSDVFLDAEVKGHLESILGHLMESEHLLDFNADIPGLSSFYDLYTQLLEQFAACSYGDATFCRYLLVPLAQRHSASFRRQAWGEHGAVLRVLRLPLARLPMPSSCLLEPAETEPALLDAYLAALARGAVRAEWSPIPFAVALHHLATFVAAPQTDERLAAYQATLRERTDAMGNAELRDALKNYAGFPATT